jgi:xyloglucan-specific exo-beta-1,4-glucanase
LGAGSTKTSYPVIYGFFTVSGLTTLYKTEDTGVNWVVITDAAHGFGAASANVVAADMSLYGRYVTSGDKLRIRLILQGICGN